MTQILNRHDSIIYVCLTDHTSGVFADDLAAAKWKLRTTGTDPNTISAWATGTAYVIGNQVTRESLDAADEYWKLKQRDKDMVANGSTLVRELDNLMQRALVLQPGNVIEASDLRFESVTERDRGHEALPEETDGGGGMSEDLRSHEQRMILETLAELGGNRQQVARQLGISPRTLRYKLARMRECGIDVPGAGRA